LIGATIAKFAVRSELTGDSEGPSMNKLLRTGVEKAFVEEIMATDVVTVSPSDTVHEALALMLANHISALPVINARGRCVGVLSTTDILNLAEELEGDLAALSMTKGVAHQLLMEGLAQSEMASQSVNAIMTPDIVHVRPGTTVAQAAAAMVRNQVHRVIVTDDEQRLLGVVSTMDVLRVLAGEIG
jgi:CBS domain-containing protein